MSLKFSTYLSHLASALQMYDGELLAELLDREGKFARRLLAGLGMDADSHNLQRFVTPLQSDFPPFGQIALSHALVLISLRDEDWSEAYAQQAVAVQNFLKYFQSSTSWCLPALYVLLNDLRVLAEQADASAQSTSNATPGMPCSEECARTVNRAFTICVTDRANTGRDSRRLGVYKVASMSMKCYFKVDRQSLCKNLIRATSSDPNIPPLNAYSRADQVTWRYFVGLLAFLNGDESGAEENLTWAFNNCLHRATRNQELYQPFLDAIIEGDLKSYDEALEASQKQLVDVGCWMIMERAREIAMQMQGVDVDLDEVECMIANMIYKGYMKGYISHGQRMVVVAKASPFPALSARAR